MAIHLERIDELALITLDRPQALNALSFEVLHDLNTLLGEVAKSDARALLVTGSGERAFCAGADIKELIGRSVTAGRDGALFGQSVFARLAGLPIFSVALELALAWQPPAGRPQRQSSACPRSSSASFPAMAARNACRA